MHPHSNKNIFRKPEMCIWFSGATAVSAIIPNQNLVLTVSCFMLLAIFMERGFVSIRNALIWMLPISLPLFVVHGIINPAFKVTWPLVYGIAIRQDGLEYASNLSCKLGIFTLGVSVWKNTARDQAFSAFVSWRAIPEPLVIILMQAISLLDIIHRRAQAILMAQQARGIPVLGGFRQRVVAFPTLIIPLVVATLIDSDARSTALISRGLGSGLISTESKCIHYSFTDIFFLACLIGLTILPIFHWIDA